MSRNLATEELPVDNFKVAAAHLRRPFTPGAVHWKIQTSQGNRGMVVSYIDARLVVERLNLVVPHLWWDDYERVNEKLLLCRLTVDGLTRQDVGAAAAIKKDIYSDALKRAAVKFGIGVSLYAMKRTWLEISQQPVKGKLLRKGESTTITPDTETYLRGLYDGWLKLQDRGGIFGPPLDHGDDPEGSVGEAADLSPEAEQTSLDTDYLDPEKAEKQVTEIYERYEELKGVDGRKLRKPSLDQMVASASSHEELDSIKQHVEQKIAEAK